MKRSEMIELMKVTAESFNGERITDDLYDRLFDKVLEAQEEVGMLPPFSVYRAGQPFKNDMRSVDYSWESENDNGN